MFYFVDFCRLCLSFKGDFSSMCNDNIMEKVVTCFSDLEFDERLPALICTKCIKTLDKFFEFRNRCIQSEFLLNCYVDKFIAPTKSCDEFKKLQVNVFKNCNTTERIPSNVNISGQKSNHSSPGVGPTEKVAVMLEDVVGYTKFNCTREGVLLNLDQSACDIKNGERQLNESSTLNNVNTYIRLQSINLLQDNTNNNEDEDDIFLEEEEESEGTVDIENNKSQNLPIESSEQPREKINCKRKCNGEIESKGSKKCCETQLNSDTNLSSQPPCGSGNLENSRITLPIQTDITEHVKIQKRQAHILAEERNKEALTGEISSKDGSVRTQNHIHHNKENYPERRSIIQNLPCKFIYYKTNIFEPMTMEIKNSQEIKTKKRREETPTVDYDNCITTHVIPVTETDSKLDETASIPDETASKPKKPRSKRQKRSNDSVLRQYLMCSKKNPKARVKVYNRKRPVTLVWDARSVLNMRKSQISNQAAPKVTSSPDKWIIAPSLHRINDKTVVSQNNPTVFVNNQLHTQNNSQFSVIKRSSCIKSDGSTQTTAFLLVNFQKKTSTPVSECKQKNSKYSLVKATTRPELTVPSFCTLQAGKNTTSVLNDCLTTQFSNFTDSGGYSFIKTPTSCMPPPLVRLNLNTFSNNQCAKTIKTKTSELSNGKFDSNDVDEKASLFVEKSDFDLKPLIREDGYPYLIGEVVINDIDSNTTSAVVESSNVTKKVNANSYERQGNVIIGSRNSLQTQVPLRNWPFIHDHNYAAGYVDFSVP